MRRTYFKTITEVGKQRKRQRLVYNALRLANPELFQKLVQSADEIIFLDNADVRSKINENGLDQVHRKSRTLKRAKAEHLRERGICVDGIIEINYTKKDTK